MCADLHFKKLLIVPILRWSQEETDRSLKVTTAAITVAALIFVANALHMRSEEQTDDISLQHIPDLSDFNQ